MKKALILVAVSLILTGCACFPVGGGLPEGKRVKLIIQDKTFKGELLSVTSELIVIRYRDEDKNKDIILGCPTNETEIVKVPRGCGPIAGLLQKDKKYAFKDNTPAKIGENVVNLSHDSLYASKMPDWVKEQMTPYSQL